MSDASKITSSHRSRRCLVYVRQSTLAQTRASTESLERQYELAGRAGQLGWHTAQIVTIDADLGQSGARSGATPATWNPDAPTERGAGASDRMAPSRGAAAPRANENQVR